MEPPTGSGYDAGGQAKAKLIHDPSERLSVDMVT